MLGGKEVKEYLNRVISSIDQGKKPPLELRKGWVRALALPAAVSLSFGLSGCLEPGTVTKEEVAEATEEGTIDELCESVGLEPGCDFCEENSWYGDGVCDVFCPEPDLDDCSITPEYGVPFEVCDDGEDNDLDGQIDCCDDDCADDMACMMRYMAPFDCSDDTEVCDDEIDNDGDGRTDCADTDCADDPACAAMRYMAPFEDCGDDIDNDGDGDIDCADSSCADDPECATMRYMAPFD